MRPRHERLAEQIRLNEVLTRAKPELMRYPGVLDVGVGMKERDGLLTDEMVFRVYVAEKKPPSKLPAGAMIPKEILGVPTDVVLESVPEHTDDDDKYRPLQGGIRIGNDTSAGGGTLGCIAQRNSDSSIVLLGNKHVMLGGDAANGEKIGQPSIYCCCCCKGNVVGEVVDSRSDALVDCAIARILGQPGYTNEIQDVGLIFGSAPLNSGGSTVVNGDRVKKRGSSTGLTTGTVSNANKSTPANPAPDQNIPARTNQIEVTADPGIEWFQFEGDSGAVLLDENNVVVGLMWGKSTVTKRGIGCRITDVISALNITIINSGTAGTIPLGAAPSAEELAGAGVAEAPPLSEITPVLERSAVGRRLLQLFDAHGREINSLLETNREVKVAWHRFQGPAFTAHVIESARDRAHAIPTALEGVTPANLVIRMSVVLQDEGSQALAAAVEANTLPLLQLFTEATSVHELLERVDVDVDAGVATPATSA